MVPIHDTDVAHERWSKAEWENYELWEKVEVRLRRHKRIWILASFLVFISLSAVPIAIDRWPKWTTRFVARHLAQEINRIKREAIKSKAAYRIRFTGDSRLNYVVEQLTECASPQGEIKRAASLVNDSLGDLYSWIAPLVGKDLGIPGVVGEFCYDYLAGSYAAQKGEAVIGFGIIPAKDLGEKRLDRLSLLLLSGPSGEMSFD
jgi:hypothetical protein